MRLGELRDERRCGYKQDRVADRDGLTADRHRQVGLANPRRAEEQKCLAVGDKASRGELADLALVDRGLGREVEAGEVAHEREPGEPDAHLDTPLVLAGDLALAEHPERLSDRQLAATRLVHQAIELIADGRQLEAGEHRDQMIVGGIHQKPPPIRASYSASGRSRTGSGSQAGSRTIPLPKPPPPSEGSPAPTPPPPPPPPG